MGESVILRKLELIKIFNRISQEKNYSFFTFGDFDYVNTSLILNKKKNFLDIWNDYTTIQENGLNENKQIYYLVCNKDKQEEADLWKLKKNEFLMVSLMHLYCEEENISNLINSLEARLNGQGNISAICYITPNNSDLICVIKTTDYKVGINKIMSIDGTKSNDDKIIVSQYTYTVPCIPKTFVNDECYIDSVTIHFTLNVYKDSDGLFTKIKNDFLSKDNCILQKCGHDDYALQLFNKKLFDILNLFKNDGLFYTHKNALLSTRTYLYVKEPMKAREQIKIDVTKNDLLKAVNNMIEVLNNKNNRIAFNRDVIFMFEQTYNSLFELCQSHLYDYSYQMIKNPILMFIKKLKIVLEQEKYDLEQVYLDVTTFLDSCNILIQNTINDDIHSNQLPLFNNPCLFNVPGKLLLYYEQYIRDACVFLKQLEEQKGNSGKTEQYEFLVSPSFTSALTMKVLFSDEYPFDRLLLIDFPTNLYFDMKKAKFTLFHECSHFVGSKIRNRMKREKCIINALSKFISLQLFSDTMIKISEIENSILDSNTKQKWKENICTNVTKKVNECLATKMDEAQREEFLNTLYYGWVKNNGMLNQDKEKHLHSYPLQSLLTSKLQKLNDTIENIVDDELLGIEKNLIDLSIDKSDKPIIASIKVNLRLIKENLKVKINRLFDANDIVYSVYGKLDHIIKLTRETYADILSLIALDVKWEDYINFLLSEVDGYIDVNQELPFLERIALCAMVSGNTPETKEKIKKVLDKYSFSESVKSIMECLEEDLNKSEDHSSSEDSNGQKDTLSVQDQDLPVTPFYPTVEIECYNYLKECYSFLQEKKGRENGINIDILNDNQLKKSYNSENDLYTEILKMYS